MVARRHAVRIDAVLVRPLVSRAVLRGTSTTTLVQSSSSSTERTQVVPAGSSAQVRVYDGRGRLRTSETISGTATVRLPAHGIAVVTG